MTASHCEYTMRRANINERRHEHRAAGCHRARPYSCRSATMGSTLVARRDGM